MSKSITDEGVVDASQVILAIEVDIWVAIISSILWYCDIFAYFYVREIWASWICVIASCNIRCYCLNIKLKVRLEINYFVIVYLTDEVYF